VPRVTVVLPTYNEVENLPRLATALLGLAVRPSLLVVDDASPDGTGAVADALAAAHPERVGVIHRAAKLGLGTAYLAGFRSALATDATHIATMDTDFSHDPEELPSLLRVNARIVIGSRYVEGGRVVGSPIGRRILSRGANAVARAAIGLATHDATAGFRVYQRAALEALPLESVLSSGYSFLVELVALAEAHGLTVVETPVVFRDRRDGVSKISRGEIFKGVMTVARLGARRLTGRTRREAPLAAATEDRKAVP